MPWRICTIFLLLPSIALGHGAMVSPRPRSSHNQILDERNKCGCEKASGCYSQAGWPVSTYCGIGCIGESCLYYHIGCYQSCSTCSYTNEGSFGHLYPTAASIKASGCQSPLPVPTLGGGDMAEERRLRTYNIDNDSPFGDWTRSHPWRSPGTVGHGNINFQACGVNSGARAAFPMPFADGQAPFATGSDLRPLTTRQSVWTAGSIVEASWAIYANHGGGYSYRICRKDGHSETTEACYQQTPLDFATNTTEIRYIDGSRAPFLINATTTSIGTWPIGSQWRKNPIPMCNCDAGINCKPYANYTSCSPDNPYACYNIAYRNSYLAPGQRISECPTGLMFPAAWDEGAGAGETPHAGMFSFEMVDFLRVPNVSAGEYSLSWRWDSEQTPQVWNSCADITITVNPEQLVTVSEVHATPAATAAPNKRTVLAEQPTTTMPVNAKQTVEPMTEPVQKPMACSVTSSVTTANLYFLNMAGSIHLLGQQNFEFVAAGKFLSKVRVLADQAQHCTRADYAGCSNYGSPFALNCVCSCEVEDMVGAGCAFNWTASVFADSIPICRHADFVPNNDGWQLV